MKNQAFLRLSASILLITLLSFNANSQVNSIVVVSECNQQGWSAVQTTGASVFVFFPTGPTLPPMSEGSGQFNIGALPTSVGKLESAQYSGTLLSSLSTLTYFSYVEYSGFGDDVYVTLNVDYDGNGTQDDKLYFQPVLQNGPIQIVEFWKEWDALHGLWWSQNGAAGALKTDPKTLVQILTGHAAAKLATGNSIAIVAQNETGNASGFQGNIDALKIGFNNNTKIFDFEAAENLSTLWFRDADGDGWGDTNVTKEDCNQPSGYVANNYDCDDNNTKKKEQILVCRDHKEKCIKPEDLKKHEKEGYIAGPCEVPCKGNKVLMCHDGKMKCVKPEEVEKKKKKGWTLGRCGAETVPLFATILNAAPEIIIAAFPNPTAGRFNVDLNEFKNQKILLELSGDGAQVIERRTVQVSTKGNVESFDLATKKPGLYILKVINEKSVNAVKVIVTR